MKNTLKIHIKMINSSIKRLMVLCCLSLLTGCFPSLVVTYKSEPTAATLFEGNNNFGYAPVSLTYQLTPADIRQGYKIINGTYMRWPSGATAVLEQHVIDLSKGYNQEFTFLRPQGVSGLSEDVQFALEAEKSRIHQDQLNRQAQANFYANLQQHFQQQQFQREQIRQQQLQQEQIRQSQRQKLIRRPYRCRTQNVDGTLITDCE